MLLEYRCCFTEKEQSTGRARGRYKGLEGGICWARGCSPHFLLLELPGHPLRHRLPPCLVTTQPASHHRDSLAGSCSATRPAWMLPDPASVIAHVAPCTPHVLLPTSLRDKGSREHVSQMRTLKPRVLPLRTQGQAGAGLGLKTESKTPEDGVLPMRVLWGMSCSRQSAALSHGKPTRTWQWPECSSRGEVPDEAGGHSLIVATTRVCARRRSKHRIALSHASLIFTRNGRYYGYLRFTWKKD